MDAAVSAHQRKIELQAPEDLTYLLANVRRAAAERINEAFPPVEGADGEDELRNRIERLVEEVKCPSDPVPFSCSFGADEPEPK
jgi:kinetochor protein Mis14/NSL1